jgi:7,8-dihydroneopterin aldolase/epimerase/oxygenase
MDTITIHELEIFFCVGVSDVERAKPQRLLLTLDISQDVGVAADKDDLRWTIDYGAVCRRLVEYGQGRSWHLIETLAVDIADVLRYEFGAVAVTVEVKKFVLPQTGYVSVRVSRPA